MAKKANYVEKNSDIFHKRKILRFKTVSPEATEKLGITIARKFIKKHKIKCVIFSGPFGAGKTTLIRGIIKELTGHKNISSPSFIIVNEYAAKNTTVFHFDFYRIKNYHELESFGFKEYLDRGLLLIEWPESVIKKLPEKSLKISIRFIDFNNRKITITFPEKR